MTTKAEALEALNALEVDPGSVPNWSAFNTLKDFIHSVPEWQPIGPEHKDCRMFVSGYRERSRGCAGYWWVHDDVIRNGKAFDHPGATLCHPFPTPPITGEK